MWLKGILHCEISVDNILHRQEGAEVGNRGVLTDRCWHFKGGRKEAKIAKDDDEDEGQKRAKASHKEMTIG